ncbi:MAG: tetratricopeptide repeat protein [Sphingomicrobium sp.]
MKSTLPILALALASAAFGAAPASAQYGSPAPAPQPKMQNPAPAPAPTGNAAAPDKKVNVSKAALKPIRELQAAVEAKDTASIPAKLAAAQAVAKSSAEKYIVAQLQLKAAVDANNELATGAAIEAMIASGGADAAQTERLALNLGKIQYTNKQYPQAAASFERVLAANPNSSEALVLLAETRNSQGKPSDAVALLQRALKAKAASGQKADAEWYKRAVGLAYENQLPSAVDLSRQWVAAYPTPSNWRDALRVYRKVANPPDPATLDALRLARAAGALEGDSDFHNYAVLASVDSPGEARAVIDEAIAAKKIDPNKQIFRILIADLKTKRALGRELLPQLAKEAKASASARLAVRTGDAFYGYGDYAPAIELYRAALTKSGSDANLVNLHLGMALARSGDKAGAAAALNAVTGPQAEIAKFWLIYVGAQA